MILIEIEYRILAETQCKRLHKIPIPGKIVVNMDAIEMLYEYPE
jgi:hypothetical protein